MSFETFTAILNAARFPFVKDFQQRTIIIPGIDNPVRTPKSFYGNEESANFELAQVFYCQNVMPSSEGMMSVGFSQVVPSLAGAGDFDQVITLRDTDENNFLFSPSQGKNYIYTANRGTWLATNSFYSPPSALVTRSYVNGRTFIGYEQTNVFEYNTVTQAFNPVAFTGISAMAIDGVAASNNYNIAWNNIAIYWSSLVDPTDFVPSINTGAGTAIPQDVKGPIRAIVPISGGFVVYTTKNAVAALYTNNARAPFVFKEISNAGGINSPEQISLDASLGYHYAWTTAGLQKITVNGAEFIDSSVTDFLAGMIFESFDIATLTWTVRKLNSLVKVKLTFISGRYLVISYGEVSVPQFYTHALILDIGLNRWGKIRYDHVDCFPYPYPNMIGQVTEVPPKQSVGFLSNDGTVKLLVMDYREGADQGVLLLGKYQLVRQKEVTFQGLELNNVSQAFTPSLYLLLCDDGQRLGTPALMSTVYNGNEIKRYDGPAWSGSGPAPRRTAKSFAALVVGTFELSSAVFTITRHGNR